MSDIWASKSELLDSPADNAAAVTPNDSTDLAVVPRGLYVGGAGTLIVHMKDAAGDAASVSFVGVAGGSLLPIRPSRVLSTGTTATNIVAVW